MTTIRVEAPDPMSAARLERALGKLGRTSALSRVGGRPEVVLHTEHEELIAEALAVVKRWLRNQCLTTVKIWIDSKDCYLSDSKGVSTARSELD